MKQIALAVLLVSAVPAVAQKREAKPTKSTMEATGAKLSTDFKLDGHMVRGKYQSPTQGLVTVENEKGIDDLLDYRKNFDDRIRRSKTQR